eukprot:PITA_09556
MQYKSAKEIWDKIVLSYEGDDQVKREKLQTLRIQYENLKMYNDESVANYFLRVDEIVNCHYAAKCPHKDKIDKGKEPVRWNKKHNANKKSYYTHEDSDGLSNSDEDERGNHYKLLMSFEDDDYLDAIDVDGFYEEISSLKTCLEEKNVIIDTLQFQLDEKEKFLEKLECEIVGLRKEIEKTKALNLKFLKGFETLDEIINVQRSPLIKTGLGYNGETSQASTSKSYLDAAKRSEQRLNRNHQVNQGQSSERMNKDYQENRGHATLRTNRSYNQPQEQVLEDNSEEQTSSAKTWRMKEPQPERCGIDLYAEGQENQWYIDSGCSKHMTGDNEKRESYTALEKGKKVSFGNDTPAAIKGKGISQLKEKVKAGNVLYVDGLKHNLLSVSQMCDNGTDVIF